MTDSFHGKKPTDREIAVALISEARNALLPAQWRLKQAAAATLQARGEPDSRVALAQAAIQRVLDFATECTKHLNRGE